MDGRPVRPRNRAGGVPVFLVAPKLGDGMTADGFGWWDMTRKVAGHPNTPRQQAERSTPRAENGSAWWTKWWGRLIAGVGAVSLIAGAIVSVRALLPEPDIMDSAVFQPAPTVIDPVALSDYQERAAVLQPAPNDSAAEGHDLGPSTARLAMTLVAMSSGLEDPSETGAEPPTPGEQTGTTSSVPLSSDIDLTTSSSQSSDIDSSSTDSSATDDSSESSSSGSNVATSSDETSESASESPTVSFASWLAQTAILSPDVSVTDTATEPVLLRYFPPEDNSDFVRHVVDKLREIDPDVPGLDQPLTMELLIMENSVDPDGHPVTPDVAATRVVEMFDHVRMAAAPADTPDPSSAPAPTTDQQPVSRQEPLGVEVDANVELSGLRDQAVWLHWSVYPAAGGTRLFGKWLSTVVADQLIPSTDHDTGSVSFWIPLPVDPGPYVAKLELFSNGHSLASATTDPFS